MAKRRSQDDLYYWYESHLDKATRTIYAGLSTSQEDSPQVDSVTASWVIKGLHILKNSYEPHKPINILLNTPGGSVEDGMAIYDAIKACPCEVHIEVFGQASSMGSIILQAGDYRTAHPNTTIMLHDGDLNFDGHARNFEAYADFNKKQRKIAYKIFEETTGRPAKFWEEMHQSDIWLTAEEALTYGLIDKIKRPGGR